MEPRSIEMLQLNHLRKALHSFASSPENFKLIRSLGPADTAPCRQLHILDSSFNPPTRAHLSLIQASLRGASTPLSAARVLLLIATKNADKAPVPAAFEDRLAMMQLFAAASLPDTPVDIAITKHARFLDKAEELTRHYLEAEQAYLTGYDTLIRVLDTKYYPDAQTLEPLNRFFARNRVICTMRDGGGWGDRLAQWEYVERIRRGEREWEGCRREWAERIQLVEGAPESLGVSSTKVREAVRMADGEALDRYLTREVKEWVLERRLYAEDAQRGVL